MSNKNARGGSIFGGALLVAGTSVGAGMLALPVFSALGGFLPAIVIYFICWAFMAGAGLLMLEATLWSSGETNIVSMAESTLGPLGKFVAWGLYIFLFYSLNVAYIAGGGKLIADLLGMTEMVWVAPLFFVALFGPVVLIGARAVDRTNVLLMIGLILSYIIFVMLGIKHVKIENLMRADWPMSLLSVPIAITSFGYQGIVPTITTYMRRDVKKTRRVILIGSAIPFVIYALWEWLVLGIVPLTGPRGLAEALISGDSVVRPLSATLHSEKLLMVSLVFAFCALVSSFLGVSLGVRDFLADGLKIKKTQKGKLLISALIFIPPIIISMTYPSIFLTALKVGGGLGCTLLLGLLPVLMVWQGRKKQQKAPYRFFGGKVTLALMILFVIAELTIEFIY